MSNNADLELEKLFTVKGRVALVTGGGQHTHHLIAALTNLAQAVASV